MRGLLDLSLQLLKFKYVWFCHRTDKRSYYSRLTDW